MGIEPVTVCPSVRVFTLSNMNISETSGPIKIFLEASLGWGALGFVLNRIKTMVFMAIDSSTRVIMGR